jgi:hypothetical protein
MSFRLRLDAHTSGQGRTNAPHDFCGPIAGHDSDDDPAKALEHFQSANVPGVLPAVGAMLFTVILDRDFYILPAHVEIRDCTTEFVTDWNLSLWPR